MGSGRWSAADWGTYAATNIGSKPAAAVFTAAGMDPAFDPKAMQFRESRDSQDNPRATPIILGCDVTGSMGMVSDQLVRGGGLNDLALGIQNRKPVSDPHIMVMAIGDTNFDSAPLQVTQFEADIRIADQTRRLWIEKGGGLNRGESYAAAHVFAARKIVSDAWDRRRERGYLITIGDEPPIGVSADHAKAFLGIDTGSDLTPRQCAEMAEERFHVFHVVLTREGFAASNTALVLDAWEKALPGRVLPLGDVTKLPETIVAAMEASTTGGWNTSTALVAANRGRSVAASGGPAGAARLG